MNLKATSGAPIINSNGEVVGLNISMRKKGYQLTGTACSSFSFGKLIEDTYNNND